jgi:hypothetical protein
MLTATHQHALLKTKNKIKNLQNWKETLELERNFGTLAASSSMEMFFSSFLFRNLSNQPRLAVTL